MSSWDILLAFEVMSDHCPWHGWRFLTCLSVYHWKWPLWICHLPNDTHTRVLTIFFYQLWKSCLCNLVSCLQLQMNLWQSNSEIIWVTLSGFIMILTRSKLARTYSRQVIYFQGLQPTKVVKTQYMISFTKVLMLGHQ